MASFVDCSRDFAIAITFGGGTLILISERDMLSILKGSIEFNLNAIYDMIMIYC